MSPMPFKSWFFFIRFFLPPVFEIMCTSTWPLYRHRHDLRIFRNFKKIWFWWSVPSWASIRQMLAFVPEIREKLALKYSIEELVSLVLWNCWQSFAKDCRSIYVLFIWSIFISSSLSLNHTIPLRQIHLLDFMGIFVKGPASGCCLASGWFFPS